MSVYKIFRRPGASDARIRAETLRRRVALILTALLLGTTAWLLTHPLT